MILHDAFTDYRETLLLAPLALAGQESDPAERRADVPEHLEAEWLGERR